MQLQYLCSFELDADIEASLGRLPPDLHTLYADIYEVMSDRTGAYQGLILRSILSWLLCAQRPMTGEELLAAVSVKLQVCNVPTKVSKDLVLGLCQNFVVFDDQLNIYRFAHLSVRDFLETRPEYSSSATNALAAEVCVLNWIQMNPEPKTKAFLSEAGYHTINSAVLGQLKGCSGFCWPIHCQLAGSERLSGTLAHLLGFLTSEKDGPDTILRWATWLYPKTRFSHSNLAFEARLGQAIMHEPSSLLVAYFVACAFDLWEIVVKMKRAINYAAILNQSGQNTFQVSVWSGSLNSIKTLLDSEKLHPEDIQSLLFLAAEPKRTDISVDTYASIIEILLDRLQASKLEEMVLMAAALNENSGILALLLDRRGDEIMITGNIAEATAKSGFKNTMEMLLDRRGSEIEITQQLLQNAASNYWDGKAMFAMLLERSGNQVIITEEFLETIAGNAGHGSALMRLVLDVYRDEIEITEHVLRSAAANNHDGVSVLKLLSDRFNDLEITDSVIIAAASTGFNRTLKFLEKLSDFGGENQKWFGISRLSHAATFGDTAAIKQAVQDRIPLDTPDKWGNTPLWWASRGGHTETVRILLVTEAVNVDVQGRHGRTPLFMAAIRNFPEIAQLLLDYGARQDITSIPEAESPLEAAQRRAHHQIVEILTEHQ